MAMQRATMGALMIILVVGIAVSAMGVLVFTHTVPGTGSVSVIGALGAYSDSGCQNPLTSVNWGTLLPGGTAPQTVYIKNIGNINATLSLSESGWNPTNASSYLALSWNLTSNYKLQPGKVVHTVLTLAVSSSAAGNMSFSFNIVITGTQS
jgi:hypothetical protein